MNNGNNKKIVFASIAVIVAAGLLVLNSSIIEDARAQMYANEYGYNSHHYSEPKSSHTDIQKIKCVNSNVNVNGIEITQIPQDNTDLAATNEGPDGINTQNGNGLADRINFDRNLVNICINVNVNDQIKVTPPQEQTCENCFSSLDTQQFNQFLGILEADTETRTGLCNILASLSDPAKEAAYVQIQNALANTAGVTEQERNDILRCLQQLGLIIPPP